MVLYWVWLSRLAMSDREKLAVVAHFGNAEDAYYAGDVQGISGLSQAAYLALQEKSLEEAERIIAVCAEKRIRILTWQEPDYPQRLRTIADPPLVLYVRGELPDFENRAAIGVVGTRKASVYGLRTARRLGGELAACGGLVVSGMAAGIDAEATEGALSKGCPAVGVLGCGVDMVYPAVNRPLFRKMERQGCLISEFVPGTPALKWNFPKRNRIISGISDGVLVVEAPRSSGALITAHRALEQGRDVFVVPGNVDVASCEGSNALLKDGASMAGSGWDVLSEYAAIYPDSLQNGTKEGENRLSNEERIDISQELEYSDQENGNDETETTILGALAAGQMHVDALSEVTGLSAGQLLGVLTVMEINGQILTLPGGWVSKS